MSILKLPLKSFIKKLFFQNGSLIPDFPNFRTVEPEDINQINSYAHTYRDYSDFTFSNLWSWDLGGKCLISKLNSNLVVLFTDYSTNASFLSFIGDKKPAETAKKLLEYTRTTNISESLGYLPEESANIISKHSNFIVNEDRDIFDYVYSPVDLSKLEGSKYKSKRNAAKKFKRNFPNCIAKLMDINDLGIQDELRKLVHKNKLERQQYNRKAYYLDLEEKAFDRTLAMRAKLNLLLTCIIDDGTVIGFSVDEIFPNKTALSHFIKADLAYGGIFEYLNMCTAKHLADRGILSWNWVEDLGIENLRKSKMSYRPTTLLKKYKVSLS